MMVMTHFGTLSTPSSHLVRRAEGDATNQHMHDASKMSGSTAVDQYRTGSMPLVLLGMCTPVASRRSDDLI